MSQLFLIIARACDALEVSRFNVAHNNNYYYYYYSYRLQITICETSGK